MTTSATTPEPIRPEGLPPAGGPYTPGIRLGNVLYCSGATPFRADGTLAGPDFAAQVRQTFENLETVCRAAGTSMKHAVRIGVYLSTLNHFAEMNEIYREYVGDPLPARTTVPVDLRGFDIEIDAVVAIPQ